MAFPVVEGEAHSVRGTDVTSHTVSLPASIAAGELLLLFFACDGTPTITTPSGWTALMGQNGSAAGQRAVYRRTADGSEGATVSVTTSAAEESAHRVLRISGWDGAAPSLASTVVAASGSPQNYDPPNLTPAGGAKDFLWVAGFGGSSSIGAGFTVTPANLGNLAFENSGGTTQINACCLALGRASSNAASFNPNTWTSTDQVSHTVFTVAVAPAAAFVGVTGTLATAFDDMTIAGSAQVEIGATAGIVFDAMTITGTVLAIEISAIAAPVFDDMRIAGSAQVVIQRIVAIPGQSPPNAAIARSTGRTEAHVR